MYQLNRPETYDGLKNTVKIAGRLLEHADRFYSKQEAAQACGLIIDGLHSVFLTSFDILDTDLEKCIDNMRKA